MAAVGKPALGLLIGAVLGVLDGASAWAYPEARGMIVAIVVSSTIKGALTGLIAGFVARRVRNTGVGIGVGLVVGCVLSVLAAATAPPGPDGSQHYVEIVLPGMLLGAIVGFATQKFPRETASTARTPLALAFAMVVASASASGGGQGISTADPLQPVDFLIGTWKGTTSGTPGDGTAEREYTRVLNSRFIQIRNRSVYPPQPKNRKGEVHEDVGFISFDRIRDRFVLRQFHIEGFVNQYSAQRPADGERWVFTSDAIENIAAGWRARETYTPLGHDSFEEIFELAEPSKDFEVYSRARFHRVR